MKISLSTKILSATVIITALGYFIDMFDMFLFNVLRVKSLTELGLKGSALTEAGLWISNFQWIGFILGAYLSGVLGDRVGRKKMLFIAIGLYSLGSLGCAFVHDVNSYGWMRLVAGLGLAGELGAGITLISEKLTPGRRGIGVMIFILMGFLGVITAAFSVELMYWRHLYILGAALGGVILFTRLWLRESQMYEKVALTITKRGGLGTIFKKDQSRKSYLSFVFIVLPFVFIPQIIWTLSPEIARTIGIVGIVKPNIVIGVGYTGVILGDLIAIGLSEWLKSRRKAVGIFLTIGLLLFAGYIAAPPKTLVDFYWINGLLGVTAGTWVIGAIWIAESFKTTVRSTVTTTIPNFARALTIPMNMAYGTLACVGSVAAVGIIGAVVFGMALIGVYGLQETYGKDLEEV